METNNSLAIQLMRNLLINLALSDHQYIFQVKLIQLEKETKFIQKWNH